MTVLKQIGSYASYKSLFLNAYLAARLITEETPSIGHADDDDDDGERRGINITVFTPNRRGAALVILCVYRALRACADLGWVRSMNKTESISFVTSAGTRNELFVYPARPENLRACGGGGAAKSTLLLLEPMWFDKRVLQSLLVDVVTAFSRTIIVTSPADAETNLLIDSLQADVGYEHVGVFNVDETPDEQALQELAQAMREVSMDVSDDDGDE